MHQLRHRRLTIAIQHAGVVEIEQRDFDAGEAGTLAVLDDDDVLGVIGIENGHAVDSDRA